MGRRAAVYLFFSIILAALLLSISPSVHGAVGFGVSKYDVKTKLFLGDSATYSVMRIYNTGNESFILNATVTETSFPINGSLNYILQPSGVDEQVIIQPGESCLVGVAVNTSSAVLGNYTFRVEVKLTVDYGLYGGSGGITLPGSEVDCEVEVVKAPVATVKGKVTDASTGAVISGANIFLGDQSCISDENGTYTFSVRAGLNYTLTASRLGYLNYTSTVFAKEGNSTIGIAMTRDQPNPSASPSVPQSFLSVVVILAVGIVIVEFGVWKAKRKRSIKNHSY